MKNVLYVQILKGLYGMKDSALIYYYLFYTTLSDMEFKFNPYERCIVKKVIDEHKCNIRYFVYNNKVSHTYDSVNPMIADIIEEKFGSYLVKQERSTRSLVWISSL